MINKGGSMGAFVGDLARDGLGGLLASVPRPCFTGRAAQLVAAYGLFEALLLVFMPGKTFYGPVTAGGNRPVYKARALLALGPPPANRCAWPAAAHARARAGQRLPVLHRHLRGVLRGAEARPSSHASHSQG